MNNCKVCGKDDLFTACTGSDVCSVCTQTFFGGGSASKVDIRAIRDRLELEPGEFFHLDHGAEAARILGRA